MRPSCVQRVIRSVVWTSAGGKRLIQKWSCQKKNIGVENELVEKDLGGGMGEKVVDSIWGISHWQSSRRMCVSVENAGRTAQVTRERREPVIRWQVLQVFRV